MGEKERERKRSSLGSRNGFYDPFFPIVALLSRQRRKEENSENIAYISGIFGCYNMMRRRVLQLAIDAEFSLSVLPRDKPLFPLLLCCETEGLLDYEGDISCSKADSGN